MLFIMQYTHFYEIVYIDDQLNQKGANVTVRLVRQERAIKNHALKLNLNEVGR